MSLTEQELRQLKWDKEREMDAETEHLQNLLKEKEAFIKVHVHSFLGFPLTPVQLIFMI